MQIFLLVRASAFKVAKERWFPVFLALSVLAHAAEPAKAGGMGRFLGSLVARGAVRGAIIAGRSQSETYAPKVYGSDVLTVEQLALCVKQAGKLDGDNERLEADRSTLLASKSAIDASIIEVESQRPLVDHYSKRSVEAFNALVDRYNGLVANGKAKQASFNAAIDTFNFQVNAYNATCVKKYYADDLPDAQKLAAQP
jgi:hypothetical protein